MSCYPTKIVLAVDGSTEAKLAARHAVELGSMTGSELHVVHVGLLSHWVHPDTLSAQQYQRLKDDAQQRLEDEVREIEAAGGKVAKAHLRMGRVDSEVIRVAEEIGSNLIIVGNRGIGALTRILLGVDAESIVRHAPCPVLVVREAS
jgi:nucleotide-binding universal stress UspA family protein